MIKVLHSVHWGINPPLKHHTSSFTSPPPPTMVCSNLTIKAPEKCPWSHSRVFIVNFEHISHFVLVFLLLTLNMQLPAGTIWQNLFSIISLRYFVMLKNFKARMSTDL